MHFHPGMGAFDQGVGKFPGDVAGPVDVGFHVDAVLRAANGRQHGREVLRAVLVVGHGVAFGDAGTQQRSDLAPELHAVHCADVLQPMLQLLLVGPQIERDDDDHPRAERPQRRPSDPPLRLCARHGHRSFFCRVFFECASVAQWPTRCARRDTKCASPDRSYALESRRRTASSICRRGPGGARPGTHERSRANLGHAQGIKTPLVEPEPCFR